MMFLSHTHSYNEIHQFLLNVPLVPVMDVHSEESSGNDDAQDGAGHEERVDGDVDLCVLDQQQCAVFGRVPAKFGEGNT